MQNEKEKRTILLVEGSRTNDESRASSLEKAGFHVALSLTGRHAISWAQANALDLVIFDAASMRSSGTRTCRRLRGVVGDAPIIHCRAAGRAEDTSVLADVYLEEPFSDRKLLNRVRDLLPADPMKEEIVYFGHIKLYRSKRSVDVSGKGEQRLTPKLAQLIEEFMRHPNELISRRQLMRNVWHTDYVGDTRTLDVHIRWVRECIEKDPSNPELLRTVRGRGFILAIMG